MNHEMRIILARDKLIVAAAREDGITAEVYGALASGKGQQEFVAVSLDDPTRVSYADEHCKDVFDYDRRKITTLHRYISRRLKLKVDDRIVSAVVAAFSKGGGKFEIRNDIQEVYNEDCGPYSCMTQKPYMEWLESGPCQVLTYAKPGKDTWCARALLWHGKYIDRIYPSDPYVITAYEQYAEDNGMETLSGNDLGSGWSDIVSVTLPSICPGGLFPYMDNVCLGTIEGNHIILSSDGGGTLFDYTNGGPRIYECDECCEHVFSDDFDDFLDVCTRCAESRSRCSGCNTLCHNDDLTETCEEDIYLCSDCADNTEDCTECRRPLVSSILCSNGEGACPVCADALPVCWGCSQPINEEAKHVHGYVYCETCHDELDTCVYCGEPGCESLTEPTFRCGVDDAAEAMSTNTTA